MEPVDNPPSGVVWWNGTFPVGYWRAGAESDPRADPSGGRTVSSFAVLDEIVQAIVANRKTYPRVRLVVIAGHSSGGQIVQRHALFTRLPPSLPVRHAVANPSSFAYLDARRWVGRGTLGVRPGGG